MKFFEFLTYIFDKLYEIRDAIMGSFVVFLYSLAYSSKSILKNILDFIMGSIFAVYFAPVVHTFFPGFNLNFLAFAMGMLGVKIIEVIFDIQWKTYINLYIKSKFKK